jgi:hypothetical protein
MKQLEEFLDDGYQFVEQDLNHLSTPIPTLLTNKLWRRRSEPLNFLDYEIDVFNNIQIYEFHIKRNNKKLDYILYHELSSCVMMIYFLKRDPDEMEQEFIFCAKLIL